MLNQRYIQCVDKSVRSVRIKTHINGHVISYTKTNSMMRTQRKQLTDLQKGEILALKEEHQSQRVIAKKLKIPPQTIQDFLQRLKKRGTHENLPRAGRPHITTEKQDQELYNTATTQRIKYNKLRELLNLKASIRTLRRRLREEHIRKWRARGCPKITQRVGNERFQWAMKYKGFHRRGLELCRFYR